MEIQSRLYWRILRALMDEDPFFKEYNLLPYKFIVVNRKNCKPMVWDFPLTQTVGDIKITTPTGYIITWRDPFTIGKELRSYLDNQPDLPADAKNTDIVSWLKSH